MPESLLPALSGWRLWKASKRGDGAYINIGGRATPPSGDALPVGGGKFTLDFVYTSGDSNVITVSINRYNASNQQQNVPTVRAPFNLAAGRQAPATLELELPPSPHPKWLPSLAVNANGHDILIHSLKVYATPEAAPAGPTSVFTWPGQWWTNTGKQSGTDLAVPAGGIFVPWASQAAPVKLGFWEVTFTYTAPAASKVSIAHNKFREADETKQTGQARIGDFDLPSGSSTSKSVRFQIPTAPDPLWTPQFQIPAGSPEVTFHSIDVHEYTPDPAEAAPPPTPAGTRVTLWDGSSELQCTLTVWDGAQEVGSVADIQP